MEKHIEILNDSNRIIPAILTNATTKKQTSGTVVLMHGIFSEKNEDGRFTRQAQFLSREGFQTLRFDYCGHGDHPTHSKDMTLVDALADVVRTFQYVEENLNNKFSVVASSFGGSLLLLYLQLKEKIEPQRIVLLNPVVDYITTFIEPVGKQMKERFSSETFEKLSRDGMIKFPDLNNFQLSKHFIYELKLLRPFLSFPSLNIPTRIIHGECDTAVPHDITKEYSTVSKLVDFKTIMGADHAFVENVHEKESFDLILDWLSYA